MKLLLRLLLIFFQINTLVGCIPINTKIIITSDTQQLSPTLLSGTVNYVSTMTVTATDTVITPQTSMKTPTPLDTLVPETAQEKIQSLLRDPMDCKVLCFWGIIPGKTSFDEAKDFFNHLGLIPFEGKDLNSGRNFYTITIYKTDDERDTVITLFPDNNLVENIVVTPYITISNEGSPHEWIAYSPETLINRFGKPSHVEIALDYGPRFVMAMIMYYDDPPIIVLYSGDDMVSDRPKSPLLCPLIAPFDSVRLWMGDNPPNPPFKGISIEKASSIAIDQFTELMLGDPQKACFTVNGELFK